MGFTMGEFQKIHFGPELLTGVTYGPKVNASELQYLANLAIWLNALNMVKWGIPEKSIKNVAQRR